MSKFSLNALLAALTLAGGSLCAAAQDLDSLAVEQLQDVVVSAVRASKNAPYAVANISRRELQDFSVTGIELPMLFARTPGILAWSENGVGTGTSYMRIRGAGGSRINVTLDGVPLNSPEDQTVCWRTTYAGSAVRSTGRTSSRPTAHISTGTPVGCSRTASPGRTTSRAR